MIHLTAMDGAILIGKFLGAWALGWLVGNGFKVYRQLSEKF